MNDSEFLWKLLPQLKQVKIAKGDTLYWKGDHADEMFFILKGGVKLYTSKGYPFMKFSEGEHFGDSDTLLDSARDSKAIAITNLKLLVLKKESFSKFVNQFKQQCLKMIYHAKKKRNQHKMLRKEVNKKQEVIIQKNNDSKLYVQL
eukprot:CAMPEP_0170568242 /NCGR_PEP_ID=MMETSP0211-20121228/81038_1 /TAXON_ID=311385 /ORGANISM="Pseudokeronopsis sp., Strain OXSARD2" /LENGTH=145 /DNA_ID=CAMNT_0010890007 /DNA_START=1414 /DNA_END=1847 /DNA_ORIENTATION=+